MTNRWILLFTILFVAACTTNTDRQNLTGSGNVAVSTSTDSVAVKNENELVCKKVKEIGSNFKRKVCRTRKQMEDDRNRSAEILERIRTSSNPD